MISDHHGDWAHRCLRWAWLWPIAWFVLGIALWLSAPRISALLYDDDTTFLPDHLPSQQAQAKLAAEFPNHSPDSRIVVIAAKAV